MLLLDTSALKSLERELAHRKVGGVRAYLGEHLGDELACCMDKDLISKGQRLGENDNWIAATVLHYSATLVYADGDFDRVTGLKRAKLGD